jgi:hypothetical protein
VESNLAIAHSKSFSAGAVARVVSSKLVESWLGLFEQFFRFDKWNACRVQAAAICDSRLK